MSRSKIKKLSAIPVAILLILSFVKIYNPGFYQKYFAASQPGEPRDGSMFNIEPKNYNGSGFNPEPTPDANSSPSLCSDKQECVARITNVVDGDTIDISTGERVRYVGVDTPETKHPIKKVQCFGKEASEKNKELVEGKEVRLEKDVSNKDRYGRLLRYVYLPAGQAGIGDLFINDYLARNGFAHAATFPPDVKFSKQFLEAEREARDNQRGLWAPGICP
ncbi:MAG: thermonuclease family protein [Candidatus Moraniibacteriota bacterium]